MVLVGSVGLDCWFRWCYVEIEYFCCNTPTDQNSKLQANKGMFTAINQLHKHQKLCSDVYGLQNMVRDHGSRD